MKNLLACAFMFFLVSPIIHASDAPFGLEWGMTKKEVKELGVTLQEQKNNDQVYYTAKSLPKNLAISDIYYLYFDRMLGLYSVSMFSVSDNDQKSKTLFEDINNKITNKYGPAALSIKETFIEEPNKANKVKWINVFNLENQVVIELYLLPENTLQLRYDSPDYKPIREKQSSVKFDNFLVDFNDMNYGALVNTEASIHFLNDDMVFLKSDLYSMAIIYADTSNLSREDRKYLLNNCQKNICPGTFYGRIGNVMYQKGLILEKVEWGDYVTESKEQESNEKPTQKYSVTINTTEENELKTNTENSQVQNVNFIFESYTERETTKFSTSNPSLINFILKSVDDFDKERFNECLAEQNISINDAHTLFSAYELSLNSDEFKDYFVRPAIEPYCHVFYGAHLFRYWFVTTEKLDGKDRYKIVLASGGDGVRVLNSVTNKHHDIQDLDLLQAGTEHHLITFKYNNNQYQEEECFVEVYNEKLLAKLPCEKYNRENYFPSENSTVEFSGYIYFASEKPPVGKDAPPESPLCYRFKVESIEEQLSKLQKKYGAKFQGIIQIQPDGHKTLTGRRADKNNNYIPYKYFTNPEACNMAQRVSNLTVPEELKSEKVQSEELHFAGIDQYINANYAEYKNDLSIETIQGTNNGKIHFISFNHNDYCGSAGCNLIIASDVGNKIYVLWNDNVYNYKILSNIAIRLELHRSYCNQPDAQSCEYTYRIINNNHLNLKEVNGNPNS